MSGVLAWWQAVLLGVVQGLTEFLPVSSSGHLALTEAFLDVPGGGVAFAVLLHAGTLLAILLVFRGGIGRLATGGVAWLSSPLRPPPEAAPLGHVVVATVPGALVGLFLEERVEAAFASPAVVGLLLIGTAAILLATLRAPGGDGGITWRIALVVGCAQALAVLPGISRSGATIATALLLGVGRPRAAEFSFLASVPLILGSVVLEVPELRTGPAGPGVLVAGFVTSFAVGVLALRWLVGLVRRGRLHWFAPYCLAVGAAAVIWSRIR